VEREPVKENGEEKLQEEGEMRKLMCWELSREKKGEGAVSSTRSCLGVRQ
jgi:hypothetical protein